jgi:transcriptional regulator
MFDIDQRHMAKRQTDLLKGTLDLLVLKTLAVEPRHGVGVAERIGQITRGTFQVRPGSLFPALHRLEQEGYIAGEWTVTPNGHRAKYYRMTAAGHRHLANEKKRWSLVAAAIAQVLEAD